MVFRRGPAAESVVESIPRWMNAGRRGPTGRRRSKNLDLPESVVKESFYLIRRGPVEWPGGDVAAVKRALKAEGNMMVLRVEERAVGPQGHGAHGDRGLAVHP